MNHKNTNNNFNSMCTEDINIKNNFNSTCTEDINIKKILTVHVQKIQI